MDRERFLDDVAARLGRPRVRTAPPRPVHGIPERARRDHRALDRIERFRRELERVNGRVELASSLDGARDVLRAELARGAPAGRARVVSWARRELEEWHIDDLLQEVGCTCFRPDDADAADAFRAAASQAEVGITGVDFALASTGTLVLGAAPGRPRSASLLPALHLALVRERQVVDRMGTALAAYVGSKSPPASALHFITGPSRTSDIENDLTIGVHGPRAVTVILLREAAA